MWTVVSVIYILSVKISSSTNHDKTEKILHCALRNNYSFNKKIPHTHHAYPGERNIKMTQRTPTSILHVYIYTRILIYVKTYKI